MPFIDFKPSGHVDFQRSCYSEPVVIGCQWKEGWLISGIDNLRKVALAHNEKLEEQQEIIKALIVENKKLIDERTKDDLEPKEVKEIQE